MNNEPNILDKILDFSNNRIPNGFKFKDRYHFQCVECNHNLSFAPSIAMETGINSGHGSCTECKTFMRLVIDLESNEGRAILWSKTVPTK